MTTNSWRTTPCVTGRLATEEDCKSGLAAFFLIDPGDFSVRPSNCALPRLAHLNDAETGTVQTVLVIQAEEQLKEEALSGGEWELLIGYRTADGGIGLCTASEITWTDEEGFEWVGEAIC